MTDKILIVGFHWLKEAKFDELVFKEPFEFINTVELKLNDNLRNEIVGVLIIDWRYDEINMIYELPNLKVVSCNSSGTDYLDHDYLKSKDVVVKNCSKETSDSVSNIALTLLFGITRNIPIALKANLDPSVRHNQPLYKGIEVRHKTMGFIGLGSIGQCLAHKVTLAFGINVVYHQRNKNSELNYYYYPQLTDMLPEVDFLIIACPLTKATKGLINLTKLKLMKPTAYLINIARGAIVNNDDLVEALRCGIIAGAGLDVTDPEVLSSSHPLLHMDKAFVLPHIGTLTWETEHDMLMRALQNLREFLHG